MSELVRLPHCAISICEAAPPPPRLGQHPVEPVRAAPRERADREALRFEPRRGAVAAAAVRRVATVARVVRDHGPARVRVRREREHGERRERRAGLGARAPAIQRASRRATLERGDGEVWWFENRSFRAKGGSRGRLNPDDDPDARRADMEEVICNKCQERKSRSTYITCIPP